MIAVRHRSASGPLDESWEFRRGYVDATVRQGSTLVHLWIAVCSPERPVFGAAPITRMNEESWVILPARYERTWPGGREVLSANPCPVGDLLAPGMQLALTNTPASVSEELEQL